MKTINITLESRELIYDIKNKTYLAGRHALASGKAGAEAVAQTQVDDTASHDYQTKRAIESALASLQGLIGEWCQVSTETSDRIHAALDNGQAVTFKLTLPDNYNEASNRPVAQAMHSYIVCQAIAEWTGLYDPNLMAVYLQQAAAAIAVVKSNLFARTRPVRPSSVTDNNGGANTDTNVGVGGDSIVNKPSDPTIPGGDGGSNEAGSNGGNEAVVKPINPDAGESEVINPDPITPGGNEIISK